MQGKKQKICMIKSKHNRQPWRRTQVQYGLSCILAGFRPAFNQCQCNRLLGRLVSNDLVCGEYTHMGSIGHGLTCCWAANDSLWAVLTLQSYHYNVHCSSTSHLTKNLQLRRVATWSAWLKNTPCTTLCLKKVPTFKLSVTLSNLNGFSKFCAAGKHMQFATKSVRHQPPHLRHVATLSWKIKTSNFSR